jgi:hypothetical protein
LWRGLLPTGDRCRCLCHLARLSPSAVCIVWTLGAVSQIATHICAPIGRAAMPAVTPRLMRLRNNRQPQHDQPPHPSENAPPEVAGFPYRTSPRAHACLVLHALPLSQRLHQRCIVEDLLQPSDDLQRAAFFIDGHTDEGALRVDDRPGAPMRCNPQGLGHFVGLSPSLAPASKNASVRTLDYPSYDTLCVTLYQDLFCSTCKILLRSVYQ